jgi:hypothetical protein
LSPITARTWRIQSTLRTPSTQDLLAVDVAAPARPFLVLQDDPGRAGRLRLRHHVAGHLRVAVPVVDVDQQVGVGEREPQPPGAQRAARRTCRTPRSTA